MTHDEWRELLLLYVVDAVDDAERARVDAWLASGDPAAAAALAEARAIAGHVPLALEPVAPSAGMWDKLQAQLDRGESVAVERGSDGPDYVRHSIVMRIWPAIGLAAALAIASGVGAFLFARAGANRELAELQTLRQRVSGQEQRLAEQLTQIEQLSSQVDRANRTMMLVSAPRLQTVAIAGTDKMPSATGRVLWDADRRVLSFTATQLAALRPDQSYELWFVTDPNGPVSLGTFRLDDSGQAQVFVDAPAQLATIKAVAVSLEPAAGSGGVAPTGPIVMVGALQ